MLQAMMASFKSKDPHTQVGCLIVDKDNYQISMGYNGMIAGIDETKVTWSNSALFPLMLQKYPYVVHAEANAILHSRLPLADTRIYTTLFPCKECAKLIATSKIKEVIYLSDKYKNTEDSEIAKRIFTLAKISTRKLHIDLSTIWQVKSHLINLLLD